MDYLTINENINIWDHRPREEPSSLGNWVGVGLGALAIMGLFCNNTPAPATPIKPEKQNDDDKIEKDFEFVLECLRKIEEKAKQFGLTDVVDMGIEMVADFVNRKVSDLGEYRMWVITYRLQRIVTILKEFKTPLLP